MDFINKNLQQLQQLLQSMSMTARVTTGLLLTAIVISLVYLGVYQVNAGETYIYGGSEFDQAELAAMMNALSEVGLDDYEHVGNRLRIPRGQRHAYLRAISEAGATPKQAHEFDLDDQPVNPFSSKAQQENQILKTKKAQARASLMQMGFEKATVQYDESTSQSFPRTTSRTAVISVKAEGTRPLTGLEVQAIRSIGTVLNGELTESDVTVIDINSMKTYQGNDDPLGLSPDNNPYIATQKEFEEDYREKILRRLRHYNANVEVFVEIDETLRQKKVAKTLDSTPVVVDQEANSKFSRNVDLPPGGVPGVPTNNPAPSGANGPATVATTQQQARESQEDVTSEASKSIVGGSISQSEIAGMVPRKVRVSIGIPISFYKKLWAEANPPEEGEDVAPMDPTWLENQETVVKNKIEDAIKPLVPEVSKGEDIIRHIDVQTDPEVAEEIVPEPALTEHALSWLAGNWQSVGMLLMGLAGLVFLRGMIKSTATSDEDENEDEEEDESEIDNVNPGDLYTDAEGRLQRRFGTSGKSLQDELTDLVEEDVDAAASVLRTWIGEFN